MTIIKNKEEMCLSLVVTVTRLGLGLDLELEEGLLYNKTP